MEAGYEQAADSAVTTATQETFRLYPRKDDE
jgi:hypothetical protein